MSRRARMIRSLGPRPKQPFRMVYHPRVHNKPLVCQSGVHKFETRIVNGVPHLVCKKCGSGIQQAALEKTVTRKEARDKLFPKNRTPRTKEQIILDAWKRMQEDQKSKRKYGKKRMSS